MAATITGSLSNIVLDYVFIFPCGMGIFGAVFATGLAPVIGILVMAPHWLKRDKGFHIISTGLPARAAGITLSLGFPSLLAQLSSGIVMIVFNTIILGLLGNTGVAAYGVIANISLVVTSIFTGIAQGVQPLISQAYGRKETNLVGLYLKYSMISMAVFSAAVCFLLVYFRLPHSRDFQQRRGSAASENRRGGDTALFYLHPFYRFQYHSLHLVCLRGKSSSRPDHFSSPGADPDYPRGLSHGIPLGDDRGVAGPHRGGSSHRGSGTFLLPPEQRAAVSYR